VLPSDWFIRPGKSSACAMPAWAPLSHSGFEVIKKMANPQMIAMDQALAEFEVPQPDAGRWAGQLTEVAHQMRGVIRRHRDIVPSSIGFLPGGGRALRCHERVLAIMRAGGLSDSQSVAGLYLLWVIVNGFTLEEAYAGQPERTGPDPSQEMRQYFASLPRDRYPNLNAVAGELSGTNFDDRFELLIGIFVDGLAGRAGQA
jgi:TetR/AcrR family transcriptional regulator, tetracycline repressor protein